MSSLRVEVFKTPSERWAWRMLSNVGREVARSVADHARRSDAIDELSWLVTEIALFAGVELPPGEGEPAAARRALIN